VKHDTVQCGAWGCFDEFNRLKEDQLSAVSQQIQIIQDAIKAKQPSLRLLGRAVDVDFNAGAYCLYCTCSVYCCNVKASCSRHLNVRHFQLNDK
jgi:Hydrolytic ATP binding site of dynein motor region